MVGDPIRARADRLTVKIVGERTKQSIGRWNWVYGLILVALKEQAAESAQTAPGLREGE